MEEIKKKLVDIFKLEDRVLYDAAGAADIVAAAEAEAQAQQEAADQATEEARQAAEEAAKNAPPEDPSAKNEAEAGNAADIEAADDIDVDSIVDGAFADVDDADDMDFGADDITADAVVDDMRADDESETLYAEAFKVEAEEVRELVVINSSVKDAQKIIDSLGENTDVLILENGKDGLDQINDYLDENSDVKYSALHIVSHGNAGYFTLCGEVIDGEAVANDPASWASIGEHLTEDSDIMLYACNLAGNEEGQLLVSQIASLTNADVAASVDSTGARGDWDLEYSYGMVENEFIDVDDYEYSLVTITINGQDDKDSGFYKDFAAAKEVIKDNDEILFAGSFADNIALEMDKSITVLTDDGSMSISSLNITGGANVTFSGSDITLNGMGEAYSVAQGSIVTISVGKGNITWESGTLDGIFALDGNVHLKTDTIFHGDFTVDVGNIGNFNPGNPSTLASHNVNAVLATSNSTLHLDTYVKGEQFAGLGMSLQSTQNDVGLIVNKGSVFAKVDENHSFDDLYANNGGILGNYGNLSMSGTNVTRNVNLSGINIGTEDVSSDITTLDKAITIAGADGSSITFNKDINVNQKITLNTDWNLSNDIDFSGKGAITGAGMLYLKGGVPTIGGVPGAAAYAKIECDMGVVFDAGDDFDEIVSLYSDYVSEFVVKTVTTEVEHEFANGYTARKTTDGEWIVYDENGVEVEAEIAAANDGTIEITLSEDVVYNEELKLDDGNTVVKNGDNWIVKDTNGDEVADTTVTVANGIVTVEYDDGSTTSAELTLADEQELDGGYTAEKVGDDWIVKDTNDEKVENATVTVSEGRITVSVTEDALYVFENGHKTCYEEGGWVVKDADNNVVEEAEATFAAGMVTAKYNDGIVTVDGVYTDDGGNEVRENDGYTVKGWTISAEDGSQIVFKTGVEVTGDFTLKLDTAFESTVTLNAAKGGTFIIDGNVTVKTLKGNSGYIIGTADNKAGISVEGGAVAELYIFDGSVLGFIDVIESTAVIEQFNDLSGEYDRIGITVSGAINLVDAKGTKITFKDAAVISGGIFYMASDYASNIYAEDYNEISLGERSMIGTGIDQLNGVLTVRTGKDSTIDGTAKYSPNVSSVDLFDYGRLILDFTDTMVLGEVIVRGNGTLNIDGSNTSFKDDVGISAGFGEINITGKDLTFVEDVTNAYGWYHSGHYYFDDVDYYKNGMGSNSPATQTSDSMKGYKGTIYIETEGNLTFGQVISLSTFTIEKAGLITFGKDVGVAGGNFTIGKDVKQVTFGENLYVHASYRGVNTMFSSSAESVTIKGDLWNWVRMYRYHVSDEKYGLDFEKTEDGIRLKFDGYKESRIVFNGGAVSISGTLYNIGVFGNANFTAQGSARVKVGDVYNFTCHTVDSIGGDKPYVVSKEYENFLSEVFGKTLVAGSTKPNQWKLSGVGASSIPINYLTLGNGNEISGNVENVGPVKFTINGDNNIIAGSFVNGATAELLVNGSGNQFGYIFNTRSFYGNAYDESGDSVVSVNGQNVLGGILNEEKLTISNPGATKLTLLNRTERGVVEISGKGVNTETGDGFEFKAGKVFDGKEYIDSTGLEVEVGKVTINSSFRVLRDDASGLYDGKEIAIAVTVGNNASLVINGRNDFTGGITIDKGGSLSFNATGMTAANAAGDDQPVLTNYGSFLVSQLAAFSGVLNNYGTVTISSADVAGTIKFDEFVNFAGALLTVGNKAQFNGLENLIGASVSVSQGASGSRFNNLRNSGSFTLSSDASLSNLENRGEFTVNANVKGGKVVAFYDNLSNYGKLNLNGDVKFVYYMEKTDAEGNVTTYEDAETILDLLVDEYKKVNEEALEDDEAIEEIIKRELARSGNYEIGSCIVKDAVLTNDAEGVVSFGGSSSIIVREVENSGSIKLDNSSSKLVFGKDFAGDSGSIKGVGQLEFQGAVTYDGTVATTGNILFNAKYKGAEQLFFPTGKNAQGEREYVYGQQIILMGLGEVHINNNIQFNGGLDFKRGTLVIDSGATLATSTYTEDSTVDASERTIRVEENATFQIVAKKGQDEATLQSNLINDGLVTSEQNLVLTGNSDGTGLLFLAEDKSVTYSAASGEFQTLYLFAEGSATNLIISGIEKRINSEMNIESLTNNGSDIRVVEGGALTLGVVKGSAEDYKINVDKDGKLTFNATAEINGSITNNGELAATAADAVSITFNKTITNNGSFTAEGNITAGNLTSGAAENGDVNSEVSTDITGGKWNNISLYGGNTTIGGNAEVTSLYMDYGAVAELTDEASVSGQISIDTVKASLTVGSSFELDTLKVGSSKVTLNGDMTIDTLTVGKNGRVVLNGATEVTDKITVNGTLTVASAAAELTANSANYSDGKLVFSMGGGYTFEHSDNIGSLEVINGTNLTFNLNNNKAIEIGTITLGDIAEGDNAIRNSLIFVSETGSVTVSGKTTVGNGALLQSRIKGLFDGVNYGDFSGVTNGLQLQGEIENNGSILVEGEGYLLALEGKTLSNNGEIRAKMSGTLVLIGEDIIVEGNIINDNGELFYKAGIANLEQWFNITVSTSLTDWINTQGFDTENLAQTFFRIGNDEVSEVTLTVDHVQGNRASFILRDNGFVAFDAVFEDAVSTGSVVVDENADSGNTGVSVSADTKNLVLAGVTAGTLTNAGNATINAISLSNELKNTGNLNAAEISAAKITNENKMEVNGINIVGNVSNETGGELVVNAEQIDGDVENRGELTLNNVTVTGTITNVGVVSGDELSAGGINNSGTASVSNMTVSGDINNAAGVLEVEQGHVSGDVLNEGTGDVDLKNITIDGTVTNDSKGGMKIEDSTLNEIVNESNAVGLTNVTANSITNKDDLELAGTNNVDDVSNSGNITISNGKTEMGAYSDEKGASLAVKDGASMEADTISVAGSATFTGDVSSENGITSTGSVTYDGGEQNLLEGEYNDLHLNGTGTKTAEGDFTISGDLTSGGNTSLDASDASFTFNGTGEQQITPGEYGDLTLINGTKVMEGGETYTVNSFKAANTTLTSPDGIWTLDAQNASIINSTVENAHSVKSFELDTSSKLVNSTGWAVFDAYGAIGDAAPSLENKNFSALASQLSEQLRGEELAVLYEDGNIFFRRRTSEIGSIDDLRSTIEDFAHEIDIEHFGSGFHGFELEDEEFGEELAMADALASEIDAALKEIVEHE